MNVYIQTFCNISQRALAFEPLLKNNLLQGGTKGEGFCSLSLFSKSQKLLDELTKRGLSISHTTHINKIYSCVASKYQALNKLLFQKALLMFQKVLFEPVTMEYNV